MGKDASGALAKELRQSPPAGVLNTLDERELRDLIEAIGAQRRRQTAALQAAGDQALSHLPWLVRGAVKKIVGA